MEHEKNDGLTCTQLPCIILLSFLDSSLRGGHGMATKQQHETQAPAPKLRGRRKKLHHMVVEHYCKRDEAEHKQIAEGRKPHEIKLLPIEWLLYTQKGGKRPESGKQINVEDRGVRHRLYILHVFGEDLSPMLNLMYWMFSGSPEPNGDCLLYTSPSPRD